MIHCLAGDCGAICREGAGAFWDNLHQSQWLALARRAGRVWPAEDAVQPLEAPPLGHAAHALPGNGSEKGIFARMLLELARESDATDTLMIDATHLKTHRTASSLGLKKGGPMINEAG